MAANVPRSVSLNAIISPVMELMKDVINKEDNRQILQTDFRPMEGLRQDIATFFPDEVDIATVFPDEVDIIVKIWLQLLRNSLAEAERLLSINRSGPRQRCVDFLLCKPSSLSREIIEWNKLFHEIFHGFQSDLSIVLTSLQFLSSNPLHIQHKAKEPAVIFNRRQKSIQPIEEEAEDSNQGVLSSFKEVAEESLEEEEEESAEEEGLSRDEEEAEESAEEGPLSRDEAWMLFRRVAFKDDQVSMDIQERARRFADECKGMPLAINIVAAMIGQTSVHHWDACFSLMKSVDPSFPPIHPRLDAELYRLLRWSYDALPNSDVKNCFLYCAFYMENQEIDSRDLVQMWIGEGLVKSKQGTYLMDMALGRNYLKLLVDRCFFQTVKESTNVFRPKHHFRRQAHDIIPSIRVHDVIREMAMYIAQKEENCLFVANQNLRNFREIHNNNCRRISVANNFIAHLPTDLRCAELVTLILKGNTNLKELPSEFLLSLTSLRVLNLSGCTEISSVPTSIDKLRMLEFLSLSELSILELPKEICRLSQLQFLDLSHCDYLVSLPSEIGEIQNLKCLNLEGCVSLEIPREISELTSLSRLVLGTNLTMETELLASIWSLKGLKNMTELSVWIEVGQQFKDGIMGTWSEMRHLMFSYFEESDEDLPEDMKSMKKLQSFMLVGYDGCHCLPNCCKFEHLEMVSLSLCPNLTELSPLESMPNLKLLKLRNCDGLRELGIGSRGGYQRLQKLVLKGLSNLESLGGVSKREEGEGDEKTVPHLRVVKIRECDSLERFPIGMEKLSNLCAIKGDTDWWRDIRWENDNIKSKLEKYFQPY